MKNPTAIDLVKAAGFHKAFTAMLKSTSLTHEEIFNQLNQIYQQTFNEPRYASFTSYRLCRAKWLKK